MSLLIKSRSKLFLELQIDFLKFLEFPLIKSAIFKDLPFDGSD